MNDILILIFQLIVLIFSVMVHEVSHGFMAYRLGDPTAKDAGRLTLNPLKHLDFFGSFLLPLTLFLIKSPILFGWAKPVPFNPYYLKNRKRDSGLIGLSGPASNFLIAIAFGLILRVIDILFAVGSPLLLFFDIIIFINIALGIFNLVPIPPLDGSKVLFAILPDSWQKYEFILERYGIFIVLIFLLFGGLALIFPIVQLIYHILGAGVLF